MANITSPMYKVKFSSVMKLKFIFIKSKQNYKIHTNTQEFGIMSRIKDDNRTQKELAAPAAPAMSHYL